MISRIEDWRRAFPKKRERAYRSYSAPKEKVFSDSLIVERRPEADEPYLAADASGEG